MDIIEQIVLAISLLFNFGLTLNIMKLWSQKATLFEFNCKLLDSIEELDQEIEQLKRKIPR